MASTNTVEGSMYFFAYGTLASGGMMAEKCPEAKFVSRAVLKGYRQSAPNILPDERSSVDGVLWEIGEECIKALDAYENCPTWYQRKDVRVYSDNTGEVDALVYYVPSE
jgi:gamma-glutamylcyclotransferase (GGCT)/AIG2-like uncharacterized protein YtfP